MGQSLCGCLSGWSTHKNSFLPEDAFKDMLQCTEVRLQSLNLENCGQYLPTIEKAKVLKVVDGKTFIVGTYIDGSPYKFYFHLNNVNTPELHTNNEKEAAMILQIMMEELLSNQIVDLKIEKYDMCGGLIGDIMINKTYLSDWLLSRNLVLSFTEKKNKVKRQSLIENYKENPTVYNLFHLNSNEQH